MNGQQPLTRYETFVALGQSGKIEDIDTLMKALHADEKVGTSRLVDFALGLVDDRAGMMRIKEYLFEGSQMQRNYAALYFKRKGWVDLLQEAVALGKIDEDQAYSR